MRAVVCRAAKWATRDDVRGVDGVGIGVGGSVVERATKDARWVRKRRSWRDGNGNGNENDNENENENEPSTLRE